MFFFRFDKKCPGTMFLAKLLLPACNTEVSEGGAEPRGNLFEQHRVLPAHCPTNRNELDYIKEVGKTDLAGIIVSDTFFISILTAFSQEKAVSACRK
jgi:hypothetical protein